MTLTLSVIHASQLLRHSTTLSPSTSPPSTSYSVIMSFLGGGRGAAPAGGVNTDKIEMAITEYATRLNRFTGIRLKFFLCRLDTVTDFFNRMVQCVNYWKVADNFSYLPQVMSC